MIDLVNAMGPPATTASPMSHRCGWSDGTRQGHRRAAYRVREADLEGLGDSEKNGAEMAQAS
jgi:hypothetical protein